jgi:uncharacterized protein HemY
MGRNPLVLASMAEIYLRKGKSEEAIAAIEDIKEVDPLTLPYHAKLAGLYLDTGRDKKGVSKYRALLQYPDIGGHERETVLSHLIKDAEKHPGNPEIRFLLGTVHFGDGAWEDALRALQDAISLMPSHAEARFMLGQVHEKMGDMEAANREYLKTLEYSGSHPGASEKVREYYRSTLGAGDKGD